MVRDRLRLKVELARGDLSEGRLSGIEKQILRSEALRTEREKLRPQVSYPENLPVTPRAAEIVQAMRENQVLIIAGETGSGKTTQLPKMLLEAGFGICGRIACTQPRRVAALSVSRRVAEELGVQWGRQVGAKIRFSDRTNDETLVKFATDGMLLSEIQADPMMSEYDAVIVDEAHERSLNIDFLLGYLNKLRHERPDLRIVVTSATIDTEAFSKAFGNAPVVNVSGRSYPVEVFYKPVDEAAEDSGGDTYVDAAVKTVEEICRRERGYGDVLVFLPGERDIRDAIGQLSDLSLGGAELLPLFGRLTADEQERIFAPTQRRKIIVATNIAETSITVPGIRYVVDAGLARLSRYNPQTRTQRLPVEAVSQSSADQRKGRSGRVAEGICIRLYSEEDYLGRPKYTEPEIRRANLAAVILRMKGSRLGDVESFPFIDPPQQRSISAGYELLQELGALDEDRNLTQIGRRLARLPVDPTVARMLIEAEKEKCLREVLVIAAGLSIQDPRERPEDAREAADLMHRKFDDPRSDFLALLNIWKEYDAQAEKLSQRQMRRFCKEHFLSYIRMREWMDIHQQLTQEMGEAEEVAEQKADAEFFQIHRALLAGLLGNIARREDGNHFLATHNRHASLFPGSALFDKKARKDEMKQKYGKKPSGENVSRTPAWIMAAQWVETSALFARTCAAIESPWILQLGAHLMRYVHEAPTWDERGARAVCTEKSFLYGLEISRRRVNLAPLLPREATEIFIRSGLIEGGVTEVLAFLDANAELRAEVEDKQTRLRRGQLWSLDDRMYAFYRERLPDGVGSVPDLKRFLKEKHGGEDRILRMTEADLVDAADDAAAERFPDAVEVAGEQIPLSYVYKPGEAEDGATLSVPLAKFEALKPGMLDWIVPGYVEERVEAMLRALPKDVRKALFPIAEKTPAILARLAPSPKPLAEQLSDILWTDYGQRVRAADLAGSEVPQHLIPRVQVVDTENKPIAEGRDWEKLKENYAARIEERKAALREEPDELKVWQLARQKYEKGGLSAWSFADLPEALVLTEVAGVPMEAFPGLLCEKPPRNSIVPVAASLTLFHTRAEAAAATGPAFELLAGFALGRELAWFERDLRRELRRVGPDVATFMPADKFADACLELLAHSLLRPPAEKILPLKKSTFDEVVKSASAKMKGLPQTFTDRMEDLFAQRRAILLHKAPYGGMREELDALLPANFFAITPFERLQHFPRYLKAMLARAEQLKNDRVKYAKKIERIKPYAEALYKLSQKKKPRPEFLAALDELRWAIEEFKVSLFAQNLGTDGPISEKRLDALVAAAGN